MGERHYANALRTPSSYLKMFGLMSAR